jgi:hypothetical protein
LNGLREFAKLPALWKPCGNCFLQKCGATNWAMKKFTFGARIVYIVLNINGLTGQRAPPPVA